MSFGHPRGCCCACCSCRWRSAATSCSSAGAPTGRSAGRRAALMPNMVPSKPGFRRYIPLVLFLIALDAAAGRLRAAAGDDRRPARGRDRRAGDRHLGLDGREGRPSPTARAHDAPARRARGRHEFLEELPDKYRVVARHLRRTAAPSSVPPTYDHDKIAAAHPAEGAGRRARRSRAASTRAITVAQRAFGKPKPGEPPQPRSPCCSSPTAATPARADPAAAVAKARKIGLPISTVALGTAGPLAVVKQKIPAAATENVIQVPVEPGDAQAGRARHGGHVLRGAHRRAS